MESNVTLKSNIYVNKTASRSDEEFLRHISDYRVLSRYENCGWNIQSTVNWMTPTQVAILQQGQPNCALEHGTMSWGVPVGGSRMMCRCEQFDCGMFNSTCSKYDNFQRVIRGSSKCREAVVNEELSVLPLYDGCDSKATCEDSDHAETDEALLAMPLDSVRQDDAEAECELKKELDTMHDCIEKESEVIEDTAVVSDEKATDSADEYAIVVDQITIINADIQERIRVNAGPGTGKTYTVIQRIVRLLSMEPDEAILVLCFSRNAVQVIRDRLFEEIGCRVDTLIEDGRIVIRTFDSFASYMLEDELDTAWDYNTRIEEFIITLRANAGALNGMFAYLIVDEIQDVVGVRARMLLAMIDELTCGVLLLGDVCQSIFDWTVRESNDLTFCDLEAELGKRKFNRYELNENHRQGKELAAKGLELRSAMLDGSIEVQEKMLETFKEWARKKWRSYNIKALPQCLGGADELILCKTNGEAAHISQALFEDATHITHTMKQSSNHKTLAGWIAKVLHGNDGHIMDKECFYKNVEDYKVNDPDEKWKVLKSLDGHGHAPGLHIPELIAALAQMEGLPGSCVNQANDAVTISTVHRAKGSEAAHIYWMDSPLIFENQQGQEGAAEDSLKAAYVAVTRAKTDIHMLAPDEKFYMKCVCENRWIQTGFGKNKKLFCRGIAMLPEDIDTASFVLKENAESSQAVLACLEPGLPVDLYPNADKGCFEIFFDGQYIGCTSASFTKALFAGFDATNHNKNWPASIRNVFITAITTVLSSGHSSVIDDIYQASRCWIGLELGGFPNIEWY